MPKIRTLILLIFIIVSGCIENNKVNLSSEPINQSIEPVNQSADFLLKKPMSFSFTNLSKKENIPEIKVISFSSIYMHEHSETDNNLTERCYAVYGLSIKNNGSKNLDFKLNELHVRDGDHVFNTTIEPNYRDSLSEVLSDLEKETKLEDATLAPGQIINGSAAFQVNSLYNKSFLLMYNETPVPSTSFEKGIEALKTAEDYNYSVIFGIPPYTNINHDFFEPNPREYPDIWANWINRSIFEFFNKTDSKYIANSELSLIYALKAIPERNITLFPIKNSHLVTNPLLVVDETGKELLNASGIDKIAILDNKINEFPSREKNLSNVTIVRISFGSFVSWGHFSYINQDVILDKELNIIVASNKCSNFQQ